MFEKATDGVRRWLVRVFASAIKKSTRPEDRASAVRWLGQSRDIVGSDAGQIEKLRQLHNLTNSRATIKAIANTIGETVSNYRKSSMPWAMKIAIPATLAAIPFIGGQAAGVVAFGGGLGVPVLLLVFLGTSGITSIIEAIVTSADARVKVAEIIDVIIEDERLRRVSVGLKAAMRDDPADAIGFPMPEEELALRHYLQTMDPFEFEQHTMSFFKRAGFETTVTKKSNDYGVDGFVVHPDGLIVVQCKRNASENKVGRPIIQQFKGVIEENGATRGFFVTTSSFTQEAMSSASLTGKVELVDLDELVRWHAAAPTFQN